MASDKPITVWIGYDSREAVCSFVAAHSILKRSSVPVKIHFLNHRELRKQGVFKRPWTDDEEKTDLIDKKKFSTEFSHTRFLVPHLMGHEGWALFMDADMVCLSDVAKLFEMRNENSAVMCVKHKYPAQVATVKMDNRQQRLYFRKNWSSFVLWNCGHAANKCMSPEKVNFMDGGDMHAFSWLNDMQIGELPYTYNYISGISPKMPVNSSGFPAGKPAVIHYTDGGPWFESCMDVPYAGLWVEEFEDWQRNGANRLYTDVATTRYE